MNLEILYSYLVYIVLGLSGLCLLLFLLCFVLMVKISNLKKRIDKFLKPSQNHNIEAMLVEYLDSVKQIDANQNSIMKQVDANHNTVMERVNDINSRLLNCVQKVGIIRYNPFDDVGGDLCYAIAMLDEKNNGIVLNSIYSRDGCYTYAKPIINGDCQKYKLAKEEKDAIKNAINRIPN